MAFSRTKVCLPTEGQDRGRSREKQDRVRAGLERRKSEGSDSLPPRAHSRGSGSNHHRGHYRHRVSFDSASSLENVNRPEDSENAGVVKCRNNKCGNTASPSEARRTYKSCHNCNCLYCSRECRRAHWQRHRKVCLYSRASNLCIQVLSSVKKDPQALRHVSALARRGFAAQGRGAVKCFFASPEAAEKFVQVGFPELGEPLYVSWSDVLPSEMGAELYAEAVRLCESYNPETRLVLYVSVCVVREVPAGAGSGATVMWERQPVSRCAKLRLEGVSRHRHVGTGNTSSSTSAVASPPEIRALPITRDMDSSETLLLVSSSVEGGATTSRRVREISFDNIRSQLRQRGVSLRRHFPQLCKKLHAYVEGSASKFAPVTIYPKDQTSGRSFVCIIMLDADADKLQLVPSDSSRVKTVDIALERKSDTGDSGK